MKSNHVNPWNCKYWQTYYLSSKETRTGLRLHFDIGVNLKLRIFLCDISKWIRKKYKFPIRVNIYLKNRKNIKAMDGELVSATFWGPFDHRKEPYIKIAVGDFDSTVDKFGIFSTMCSYGSSLIHELTHYFQWVNNLELSEKSEERQANYYSKKMVYEYLEESNYSFFKNDLNL